MRRARPLLLAVGVIVGGCGDPAPFLSQETVDTAVSASLGTLPAVDLECPPVMTLAELSEGEAVDIDCAATLGGDPIELAVELVRLPDDVFSATVAIVTPILEVAPVEAVAAAQLDAELGGAPRVVCAEAQVAITVGREISCRVTAEGGTAGPVDRAMVVRIVDADGGWEIGLVP